MSITPQPGDDVPDDIRQELIDAIDSRNRAVSEDVRDRAFIYARQHLGMEHPTLVTLWEYIMDRLQAGVQHSSVSTIERRGRNIHACEEDESSLFS